MITDTDLRQPAGPASTATRACRRWSRWHNTSARATQANWWDDGANVIAFSRGSRGWVALNNGTAAQADHRADRAAPRHATATLVTGARSAPAARAPWSRSAPRTATVTVPAKGAVAVDRTTRR